MANRPILSLADRLNGRSWAEQLRSEGGGKSRAQADADAGPTAPQNSRLHNSTFEDRHGLEA